MSTAVLAVNNIYCNQSQCIPVSLAHRLCFRGPQNQSARHYSRRNVYSTAGRTTADLVSQVGEGNLSSSLSLFATSYPGLVIVGAQGLSRAFIDAGLWRRGKEHRRKRPTEGRPSRAQRRHGDSAYQTYSVTRSPPEGSDLKKRRKGVCRRTEIMSLKHTDPLSNVVRGPI